MSRPLPARGLAWLLVMILVGCAGRQRPETTRPRPVAVCTPHILGVAGGTALVVKTVCEVDFDKVRAARVAAERRTGWPAGLRAGAGERRERRGPGAALVGFGLASDPWERSEDQAVSAAREIAGALGRADPVAGVGDPAAAWRILDGQAMWVVLRTLDVLAEMGQLEILLAGDSRRHYGGPRTETALALREVAGLDAAMVDEAALAAVAARLDRLDPPDQHGAYLYAIDQCGRRGVPFGVREALEGMVALHGSDVVFREPVVATAPVVVPGLPAPIEPLPWARPGDEPAGMYVGNEAHKWIAENYELENWPDKVRTNSVPITSILDELRHLGHESNPGWLTTVQGRARPDIVNLTQLHIYEIKPEAGLAAGEAEVRMYLGIFKAAGITLSLGPPGAPGTQGAVPAPGGVFLFSSPRPGVITYKYRRGILVPVPVRAPQEATESTRARSSTKSERSWFQWELEPLSPAAQRAFVTAAVGGSLLILAMILLAPVGV